MATAETAEGILLADKPAGPTSHDLVAAVRRTLGGVRVGHAGTLDPFATGLLLLFVGRATRLAEYASALEKTYRATLRFGAASTTGDPGGEITEAPASALPPALAAVRAALGPFLGEREQVPHAFSAKRVGGERAYRLARRGAAVTLAPQRVRIDAIELLEYAYPRLALRLRTGPGVYVRSLARDLGHALGTEAYLTELRREAVGPFSVDHAVDPRPLGRDELLRRLRSPETAVEQIPALHVEERTAVDLAHGKLVAAPAEIPHAARAGGEAADSEAVGDAAVGAGDEGGAAPGARRRLVRLVSPGGFLGIGALTGGTIKPVKILYPERALR